MYGVARWFGPPPRAVARARRLVAGRAALLAKIEEPAGLERLEEMLEIADAVLVARGDLGVELPPGAHARRARAGRTLFDGHDAHRTDTRAHANPGQPGPFSTRQENE